MIQEISSADSFLTTAANRSRITKINQSNFTEIFKNAQTMLEEKGATISSITSAISGGNKKTESNEDLLEEFKNVTKGFSVCKTCGAMYHGTSVAKCENCGNDMKEDNETIKKMQNAQETTDVKAAKVSDISTISAQTAQN